MKSNNNRTISLLFVIFYFFREIVYYIDPSKGYWLVGNFDIFYLFGIMYMISFFKKPSKKSLLYIVIIIIYASLQLMLLVNIDAFRLLINVLKIIVCYFVYKYIVNYKKNIDLKFITESFSILCLIFLILALMSQNSNVFWRHNDIINVFDLRRLQLLYTEPGELGMHCSIMLIIAFNVLNKLSTGKIKYFLIAILPICICLYFTKSLGGIMVGVISIFFMYIYELKNKITIKNLIAVITIVLIILITIEYLISSNSSIYQRFMSVSTNGDSSVRYRVVSGFDAAIYSINHTYGLGLGFGNLELAENVALLHKFGINSAGIINSFLNVIAEGGILSISIIVMIIKRIRKSVNKNKNSLMASLSLFIILYQFMGTYFTNPLCWIIYGAICNEKMLNIEVK